MNSKDTAPPLPQKGPFQQEQPLTDRKLFQLFRHAPEQIIDSLLRKIPDAQPLEEQDENVHVKVKVDGIVDYAYSRGVHHFVQLLSVDMLQRIFHDLAAKAEARPWKDKVDKAEKMENRGVEERKDALLDVIEIAGLDMFDDLSADTLRQLVTILRFDTDAQTVEEYAMDVRDEVLLNGTRDVMQELTLDQLKIFCRARGYKVRGSKLELMDRLLNDAFPGILNEDEKLAVLAQGSSRGSTPRKKKRTSNAASAIDAMEPNAKKQKTELTPRQMTREQAKDVRPVIDEKITRFDLEQYYWNDEIQAYGKKHGINTVGNKRTLIQRILNYLKNPEDKGYKKKKKGRASRGGNTKSKSLVESQESKEGTSQQSQKATETPEKETDKADAEKKTESPQDTANTSERSVPVETSTSDEPVQDTTNSHDRPVQGVTNTSDKAVQDTSSTSDKPVPEPTNTSDKPVQDVINTVQEVEKKDAEKKTELQQEDSAT